jgi:hypothetical protein
MTVDLGGCTYLTNAKTLVINKLALNMFLLQAC